MAQILVVDDEMGIRELLSEILSDEGHDVALAENAEAARAARNKARPDLVLLDIWMPDTDGVTLLREWSTAGLLTMPVVMMSGHGSIDTAVEATRIGAVDFLEKPIALQKLLGAVKHALRHDLAREKTLLAADGLNRLPQLRDMRRRLAQMAQHARTLFIRGGSPALVELFARAVQAPHTPWLDLGALTQPLTQEAIEEAAGGVLFAGELAGLGRLQQKNLAFALDRAGRHLLVVGSARDLPQLAAAGWDEALLARLGETRIRLPGLTELREDVHELSSLLLSHFVEKGDVPPRHLTTAALNALRNRAWPGEYGELQAVLKSAALAALDEDIDIADLERVWMADAPEQAAPPPDLPFDQPLREAREAFERLYFEHHLRAEGGNVSRLAEKTGVERTHLYRKLKQLGLHGGRREGEQ